MGKSLELVGENMSLGTGNVLAALQTAASGSLAAHLHLNRLEISQSGTVTGQMIRAELATRDTAGTLTTTSKAPGAESPVGGPASGLSGNTNVLGAAGRSGINSSADSGGTYTTVRPCNFYNLNGYLWVPTERDRTWIPPSTVFVVRLLASPTTTTGWTIILGFEED